MNGSIPTTAMENKGQMRKTIQRIMANDLTVQECHKEGKMTTAASHLYLQTSNDFSFHSRTDNSIINIQGDGERAPLLGIFGTLAEDQSSQHKCQTAHNYL